MRKPSNPEAKSIGGGTSVTIDAETFSTMAGKEHLSTQSLHAAIGEVEAILRENWAYIWKAFEAHRIDNPAKKYNVSLGIGMDMFSRNCAKINATCSYGTKRSDETEGVTVGQNEPELPLEGVNVPTDDQVARAKAIILELQRAAPSSIQRRMGIGHQLAAAILDRLEEAGVVGPANGGPAREILVGE